MILDLPGGSLISVTRQSEGYSISLPPPPGYRYLRFLFVAVFGFFIWWWAADEISVLAHIREAPWALRLELLAWLAVWTLALLWFLRLLGTFLRRPRQE